MRETRNPFLFSLLNFFRFIKIMRRKVFRFRPLSQKCYTLLVRNVNILQLSNDLVAFFKRMWPKLLILCNEPILPAQKIIQITFMISHTTSYYLIKYFAKVSSQAHNNRHLALSKECFNCSRWWSYHISLYTWLQEYFHSFISAEYNVFLCLVSLILVLLYLFCDQI